MSIVDRPTYLDWPPLAYGLQRYGHFVLFRFDNLASVAILDDEEASRAAALLPQDWYLGIALMPGPFHLHNAVGTQLLDFHIYLLGVGPADPSSACIPISPAPQLADDHPPIVLPEALPWPNLYIHSFHSIKAVISRIHYGTQYFPASLTEEQQLAVLHTTTMDDYHRYDAVRLARKAVKPSTRNAVKPSTVEEKSSQSESDYDSEGGDSDVFILSDEAQMITTIFERRYNHGELWLDPSACPGLPTNPAACEEMFERLNNIGKEWYERKLKEAMARRPQRTKEWIEAVENASARSSREGVREGEIAVPLDDDAVLPEDAVDSRLDRLETEPAVSRKLVELSTIPQASPDGQAREDSVAIVPAANRDDPASLAPVYNGQGTRAQLLLPQATPVLPASDVSPSADITKGPSEQRIQNMPSRTTDAVLSQSLPTKRSTIVPDWLVSAKRTAVTSLRSIVAYVKARTPRVSISVTVRRRVPLPGAQG